MTLTEARKFIRACEGSPLIYERTELLSQGPRQGWAVSVSYVGGGSHVFYALLDGDE